MHYIHTKTITWGILAVVIIGVLLLIFLPNTTEPYIKNQIEKANYCEVKEDCILVAQGKCPFGCYVYVNKDKADTITELIEAYVPRNTCEYSCLQCLDVECKDNKCEPVCS